jgi:hypothetical protein
MLKNRPQEYATFLFRTRDSGIFNPKPHMYIMHSFNIQLKSPPDDISPYRWVPLMLLIIFVVFFPVGWGSITYILVSELVPTMVRCPFYETVSAEKLYGANVIITVFGDFDQFSAEK